VSKVIWQKAASSLQPCSDKCTHLMHALAANKQCVTFIADESRQSE